MPGSINLSSSRLDGLSFKGHAVFSASGTLIASSGGVWSCTKGAAGYFTVTHPFTLPAGSVAIVTPAPTNQNTNWAASGMLQGASTLYVHLTAGTDQDATFHVAIYGP